MGLRSGQHIGAYVIDTLLGRGGMASVWRAWDKRRDEAVAIKIMADPLYAGGQFADRFIGEIRHHARLNHPHIVQVREVFSVAGQPCMVMDLAPGGSLASMIENSPQQRLPCAITLPLIIQVLDALDYAHRQSIVHRDVKPSNVLLDASRTHAYLSDFGIALAAGETRLTKMGVSVGTGAYMSPEQIIATGPIDHRSDVYSVGCVLYESLTGQPPFVVKGATGMRDDAARTALFEMHLYQQPVPPRQLVPEIPAHVSALVMRALEKDPARRIQGCAEFAAALKAPDGDAVQGRPLSPAMRIAAAVLLLAVIAMSAAVIVSN